MKKLFITAIAVFTFGLVQAQDNAIKINPLAFFGGSDLISYERKVADHGSALIGLGFSSFKIGGFDYSNVGAELQYRYYFNEAIKGWYAGGQLGFTSGSVETNTAGFFGGSQQNNISDKNDFTSIRVGAKGGYQWQWSSGFTLDLNGGFAYNKLNYSNNNGVFSTLKGTYLAPNGSIALGYSF